MIIGTTVAVGFWIGGEGDGAVRGARSPSSLEDVDWNDERERERERRRRKGKEKKNSRFMNSATPHVELHCLQIEAKSILTFE
jgi:hypothetical protein